VIPGRARPRSGEGPDSRERGQGLVEFALVLPAFMILLLGLVEFGFIFANHQGLEYATREGARTAAALSNGQNGQNGQPPATTCTTIDNQVIAAVQRLITGKGSLVTLANVSQIRIYKYDDATGGPAAGSINVWTPGTGPVVDGVALKFNWTSGTWNACTRSNGATPDSVAVEVTYTYAMETGLGAMLKWVGANTLPMTDTTVMVLNP
jgi:Flp pilus assembly protein TadG